MYLKIFFIIPLFCLINLIFINRFNTKSLERISLIWSLILIIYFTFIIFIYNDFISFQFNYKLSLSYKENSSFNLGSIILGLDGISIFFIGLSVLLIPICILMSTNSIKKLKKEFLICLIIILLLLIGVFSILDILGFYILFEGVLIPMFLIIGIWGSREEKIKAAFYFFFYTLVGSLLMLLSIFKIYSIFGTTNYQTLILLDIPDQLQFLLFMGFFASMAVKVPMVPFHIWLPQAHVEAPIAGSILLAGILLKLGGYGFIRFSFSLFPIASEYFSPIIILMSLLAIIYASLTTFRQTDIKRFIAYSSVAHMGLVTLSIFTHSIEGLIAAITMMLAHGLVSSGLFMTSSILYVRHHSRIIKYYKGLTTTMPIFSIITLILILANISFPMTFNFIAEFFSILAGFNYSIKVGIISCAGALFSTIYALYYFNRVYFGSLSIHLKHTRDLSMFEFQGFFPIILITLVLGILPSSLLKSIIISNYINISL